MNRWKLVVSAATLAAIALGALLTLLYLRGNSTTVVFVVRHGEKATSFCNTDIPDNVELSEEGITRAAELAHVMKDARVGAVYASNYCRTQRTVQDAADNVGVPVISEPNLDNLIEQIWRDHPGQRILIAGHQTTVPLIIEKLGGEPIPTIEDPEFDNLYMVIIARMAYNSRTTVVRLKYGAPPEATE
jgi:broad specificity phosphatase PhoE